MKPRRILCSASSCLLGIFLLIAWLFPAIAAETRYTSRLWQAEDGLPHNSVHAVLQTADGYLWVGTADGVVRFDGFKFTPLQSEIVPGLKTATVISLCETRDGTLWIGTDGIGLCSLRGGQIVQYTTTNGLGSDVVRSLVEGQDGSLWIGTTGGVTRWKEGSFTNITNGLGHVAVRAICRDADSIWVGTALGLTEFQADGPGAILRQTRRGLLSNSIKALRTDAAGNLWIGSDAGLNRYRKGEFTSYTKSDGLADSFLNALHEDANGNLWVGTYSGLNRFAGGRIITELYQGMPYDRVNAICEDREGSIWVGTKAGLYRLNRTRFTSYTKQDGLSHNTVVSVYEDRSGNIWVGTWGGGLNLFQDGRITSAYTTSNGLSSDLVLGLHQDREGALWVGTDYRGGLNQIVERRITTFGKDDGMSATSMVIFEDRSGNLWVGTKNGLNRHFGGSILHYSTTNGLPGNVVKSIVEDANGEVWFGTDRGIATWNKGQLAGPPKGGEFDAPVLALYWDEAKGLWIGTDGGGLSYFQDGKLQTYTTSEGLFHDTIYEIIDDGRGCLWMSSPKGIFRIRKDDLYSREGTSKVTCISYGKSDGMLTAECTGGAKPAALRSRDGRLWFATSKGLVMTDPEMKNNEVVPPVAIQAVLVDKSPVGAEAQNGSLLRSFTRTDSASSAMVLKTPAGRGELEFHFVALSFQAPEKNRFKYKLEGVDRDWVDAGGRRVAFYTNIRPGRYLFRVKACNNDGIWNDYPAEVDITLSPHLLETWWFKSSMALALGGVIIGANRVRRHRRREIERLRIRIAADLHDDIGSNLASIALLSQIEPSEGGRVHAELSEIHRIALGTAQNVREIVWFINPDYDTIEEMVARMKDAATGMLVGIPYRFRTSLPVNVTRLSLEFRRNVFLVFKEALHNVSKHSKATAVEIEVRVERNEFELRISDNGVGFKDDTAIHGNGLKNIRLRLAQLHGRAEIRSLPGQGTTLCITASIT